MCLIAGFFNERAPNLWFWSHAIFQHSLWVWQVRKKELSGDCFLLSQLTLENKVSFFMVKHIIAGISLKPGTLGEPEDNTGEEIRTISLKWYDL